MVDTELLKYQQLSNLGDINAILSLADFYLENKKYDKAFETLSRFNYLENKDGYRKLASLYERGIGVETDIEKAKELYKKAYELDDYLSGYFLAKLFVKEEKYLEAIHYICLPSFNDHVPSIKLLADLYLKGLGVNQNIEIAINLYNKLILLGENRYFDVIGKIYYQNGEYDKAVSYFTKGKEVLDYDSIYHLAICYSKGLGVNRDFVLATKNFELAANNGHVNSLYNLAIHYQNGIGVGKDLNKAKLLLEKYEKAKNTKFI